MRIVFTKIIAIFLIFGSLIFLSNSSYANPYGDGDYGACQYNDCSLSLSTSGTVSDNITPSGGSTTCTVQSDSVGVNTDSSNGYQLTLSSSTTSTNLVGASSGATIAAASGTPSSPTLLTANTWGYRVDGLSNFGSGPTTSLSSGSIPSLTFAGIQPSSGTPDTIVNTSSPADPTQTTNVWYGVCANALKPADSYSSVVTYTALAN